MNIEEMLQQCLQGYDAGLAPEECLAPFAASRKELEPLFRQALSLRVAYTPKPQPEFRSALREKLLFAAGREVSEALAEQPKPEFRMELREKLLFAAGKEVSEALAAEPSDDFYFQARAHMLEAAGASTQEALRDVPPPKLPFWVNARRRLLEAGSAPRPARQQYVGVQSMRMGLSAAVVVLAVAFASLGYIITTGSRPTSVSADLASIEQQLTEVEAQAAAGQPISAALIVELTQKTTQVAEKVTTDPAAAQATDVKLQQIIRRQQQVVEQAVAAAPAPGPELQQAQQQLQQADARLAAARAEVTIVLPSPTVAVPTPTQVPATPTPEPSATSTPVVSPTVATTPSRTPVPPAANQVRLSLKENENTNNHPWTEIETANVRFLIPSDWRLNGITTDANGLAVSGPNLQILGTGVSVVVNLATVQFSAIVDGGPAFTLRAAGLDGEIISVTDLVENGGSATLDLRHLVESIELSGELVKPAPTPTLSPSATPSGTPTRTPTASP